MASQGLHCEGCTIHEADGYKSALTMFEANNRHIDLLVADLSLPDGDACHLAMYLKDRYPALRVLFVSHQAGTEVCRFYGLDLHGIHFLSKPFTAKQLSDSVNRVLDDAEPFPRLHPKHRTAY